MPLPPLPKHPKVRGELAETIFVSAAMRQGFRVSKPYGESAPYDFIVERRGKLSRVQVKATGSAYLKGRGGGYRLHGAFHSYRMKHSRLYQQREIDFIAGYVFRLDAWFIIPVARIHAVSIHVYGNAGRGQFEKYREAWDLLAGKTG